MAVKKRSDRKNPPRAARRGARWEVVGEVGEWEPVLAEETAVLKKTEKDSGDTKLTREDREAARELKRQLGREATRAERVALREATKARRQEERRAERRAEREAERNG
jgi:hypothetical protein